MTKSLMKTLEENSTKQSELREAGAVYHTGERTDGIEPSTLSLFVVGAAAGVTALVTGLFFSSFLEHRGVLRFTTELGEIRFTAEAVNGIIKAACEPVVGLCDVQAAAKIRHDCVIIGLRFVVDSDYDLKTTMADAITALYEGLRRLLPSGSTQVELVINEIIY